MNDAAHKTSEQSNAATKRTKAASNMFSDTLEDFNHLLEGRFRRRGNDSRTSTLEQATHAVIEALGQKPALSGQDLTQMEPLPALEHICAANSTRMRRCKLDSLKSEKKRLLEPLVAFYGPDREPVAVISNRKGTELVRFMPRRWQPLTEEIYAQLDPVAYALYSTLPDQNLKYRQIFTFGLPLVRRNIVEILLFGLLFSIIAMAMPIAYGQIVNLVIGDHELLLLVEITGALIIALLVQASLRIASEFSFLRMEARLSLMLHAAMVDRALRLSPDALRNSTSIILATQMETIEKLRRLLTRFSVTFTLAFLQCTVALALAAYYALPAAIAAAMLSLLLVVTHFYIGWKQFKAIYEGERMDVIVLAFLYDLIKLIPVLRGMRTEQLAFVQWGQNFLAFQSRIMRSTKIMNYARTLETAWEFFIYICCFAVIAYSGSMHTLSLAAAVAFVGALARLVASVKEMSHALLGAAKLLPMAKLARPFIEQTLENDNKGSPVPQLKGHIKLERVNFSYNSARVLSDVSIDVPANSLVGVVGLSGSGKSSLLRIILGLETPQSGSVYYDDHDIQLLNKQQLRRQTGAVLQHGRLFGGSILENIRGASNAAQKDIEKLSEQVGLDRDLKDMPMGLNTLIGDGGAGISGGQIQKILLARSLAHSPRILVIDEATSALDPASEIEIFKTLSSLASTRIIATHRLDLLRNADRIFVMNEGIVVAQGTFTSLAASDRIFQKLLSTREKEELSS